MIFDKPTAKILNKDTVITIGSNVNLQGSGAKYYRWLPDTYLDNPNIANPVASPGDDVTYQLIVLNDNGCSDTAYVTIRVKKKVLIPNTFTPNGDGVNDTWAIKYLDRLPGNHMFIYTRSGRLVRQFKGYYNSWDGTSSKGEQLPPEYIIMYWR
ncbi:gliding motility-associated C-terminal domain-containing protein [Mucilaginibacter sp. AK015]|uniref:T9SS type B sorting domain-containing protein n=1 Tax=Mucilaginibacter sp. AK015 TaxID=2723072 RepID=UPI0017DD6B7C|nr:gliding motility-associated C-terminal domain-containing protein [Mucilaginibacter sp. AK015]MBB5394589.1 gliding motility-associated-like protein [Mucilaginibacter sp. AK015]